MSSLKVIKNVFKTAPTAVLNLTARTPPLLPASVRSLLINRVPSENCPQSYTNGTIGNQAPGRWQLPMHEWTSWLEPHRDIIRAVVLQSFIIESISGAAAPGRLGIAVRYRCVIAMCSTRPCAGEESVIHDQVESAAIADSGLVACRRRKGQSNRGLPEEGGHPGRSSRRWAVRQEGH